MTTLLDLVYLPFRVLAALTGFVLAAFGFPVAAWMNHLDDLEDTAVV